MSSFKMQTGHDTTPIGLEELSPPLLAEYTGTEVALTQWHDYIDRVLDGNREWVEIGLPYTIVTLYRVTRAEFALLMTFEGEVSITCLNQTLNLYKTYNASLKRPEANGDTAEWSGDAIGGFVDVILNFFDLIEQV